MEEYIVKNPCRKINKIKVDKTVKETYSEEILECMREQCKNKRGLAIIDFLVSTGIRVGEMVKLNRNDIKFEDKSCIVFGKGSKERKVYFSCKAKVHLKEYLDSRNDDSETLFVSLKYSYNRLSIRLIELNIKNIGDELNIKAHPHKF